MSLFFDIKRYSINDGPGIRITIFFKGCPLSCVWCHNPEGVSTDPQKMYTSKKCIGCRLCVTGCPAQALTLTPNGIQTDAERCTLCGRCVEVCPTKATEMSGRAYTVDELMREIEKETLVMDRSEGGVTFCGGEPLMHPTSLLQLLKRCGALGIHRVVDTSLYASPTVVRDVMAETELFLVDLKHMDAARHRLYCGVDNDLILSNIRMLAAHGQAMQIRIPLIHGINADEDNISASARFLASLPQKAKPFSVHLLPYHDIAIHKHQKLGTVYNPQGIPMSAPDEIEQQRSIRIFSSYGIEATIGG